MTGDEESSTPKSVPTTGWISFRDAPSATPPPEEPITVEGIVAGGLAELPEDLRTDSARTLLETYVEQLLDTNTRINLVSRRGTTGHVARFVRESAFLARILHVDRARLVAPTHRLLDLGSGGGFPGMVLKIALPDVDVQLVEGTGKKAKFLAEVAQALDLPGLSVLWGRSEQIARIDGQGAHGVAHTHFEWVTGKALGSLVESSRLSAPFLAPEGVHWTFKGTSCEAELAQAGGYFRQVGLAPFAVEPIPGSAESYVVGIRKLPSSRAIVSRETFQKGRSGSRRR